MKKIFIVILFFCFSDVDAQLPDSIKQYIDSALLIMQQRSLYTKKVNWNKVRNATFVRAKDAKNIDDTYAALVYAFSQMKDYHGQIRIGKSESFRLKNPAKERQDTNMLNELFKSPPRIVIAKVGDYGYIRVPHMSPQTDSSINRTASRLKDSVCKLNASGIKGWIIDLRVNVGGNFRPMIGGLAPVFCDGFLGSFVNNTGAVVDSWSIKQGQMFVGETQGAKVQNPCSVNCGLPVAVLIGPSTGSSGEITAISFSSRPNTRFFGERSAGYANSTQGFYVAEKRIYMLLTTALVKNSKGKLYNHFIDPDVKFKSYIQLNKIEDDLVLRSVQWLRSLK